jgi:hypothetical protein
VISVPGGETNLKRRKKNFNLSKHDADECKIVKDGNKKGRRRKSLCVSISIAKKNIFIRNKNNVKEKRYCIKMPTTKTAKKIQFEHRSMMLISLFLLLTLLKLFSINNNNNDMKTKTLQWKWCNKHFFDTSTVKFKFLSPFCTSIFGCVDDAHIERERDTT